MALTSQKSLLCLRVRDLVLRSREPWLPCLGLVLAGFVVILAGGCSSQSQTGSNALVPPPRGVAEAIDVVVGRAGRDPTADKTPSVQPFNPSRLEEALTGRSALWRESRLDEFLDRIDELKSEEAILVDANGEAYVFLGRISLHDESDAELTGYHFCHGVDSIYVAQGKEELRSRGFRDVWIADLSSQPGIRFQVDAGALQLSRSLCSLGVVPFGSTGSADIVLTNVGDVPLELSQPEASCGCTVAALSAFSLAPGESLSMKVSVTPSNRGTRLSSTRQTVFIPVQCRGAGDEASRRIAVNALCVQEAGVQIAPVSVDFGTLHPGESVERTVRLSETATSRFDIQGVDIEGLSLKHTLAESTTRGLREYQVRLECAIDESPLSGTVPVTTRRGTIKVRTSSRREPVVVIPCQLEIHPRVSSRPGVISFGLVPTGQELRDIVRIESSTAAPFRVADVVSPQDCQVEIASLEGGAYSCTVRSTPADPGLWKRIIVLDVEGTDETWRERLEIPCYAKVSPSAPPPATSVSNKFPSVLSAPECFGRPVSRQRVLFALGDST